jgi:CRP/FNR family cyclic AMP-dependent transcriptional regulator
MSGWNGGMQTRAHVPLAAVIEHPLFEGVAVEPIRDLLVRARPCAYPAGDIVATPGSSAAIHLVLDGRLRLYELAPDGRRVIFDHVGAGGIDGLFGLAGGQSHFTEAVEDSLVAALPESLLRALVHAAPAIALNLLAALCHRLLRQEEQVERLTMRDPCQRLADQLLALADQPDSRSCPGRLSHEALADMLGLRRETVTLHLGKLRRIGAVSVERDHFLLDSRLLSALRDGHADAALARDQAPSRRPISSGVRRTPTSNGASSTVARRPSVDRSSRTRSLNAPRSSVSYATR